MRKKNIWQRRLKVLLFVLAGLGLTARSHAKRLELDPAMSTGEINQVLNHAEAGDTLVFRPGSYRGPFVLQGLKGSPDMPVVIRGTRKADSFTSLIDGQTPPGSDLEHYAFLLQDCAWISLEDFHIRNCWTDLVRAENSAYISLRNSRLEGGRRALYAEGRGSHHFLVEGCSWEQDERVWTHEGDYSWGEIHHGIHRHYNGSIFQGNKISGVFVIRDNRIRNTFNAFRLSLIKEGELDLLACTNGEIYRNVVTNTSDNVLEPEVHARNLHFYHNRMINGHAFISITEVRGGDIYIYGNTAVSLPDSDDGWTVFKISCLEDSLDHPLWIYNNSWQVDFDMIGSPRRVWENSYLRHFNNACYSEASDTFGIYNEGEDNRLNYDCSNVPFPNWLLESGHERRGIVADPLFRDPYRGDFRLEANSPCINRGKRDRKRILSWEGRRPDIGAWEGEKLVEGMPFRYQEPELPVPFKEKPRITRTRVEGRQVNLWFSLPMDAFTLKVARKTLRLGDQLIELKYEELSDDLYRLVLSADVDLESLLEERIDSLQEADGELLLSRWPSAMNGQKLTNWASELPVSLYLPD